MEENNTIKHESMEPKIAKFNFEIGPNFGKMDWDEAMIKIRELNDNLKPE